jgi:hypothetical protein
LWSPTSDGDHDGVEELLQEGTVVVRRAPGVGDQPGLDAAGAGGPDGGDDGLARLHAAEHAVDQVRRVVHAEPFAEAPLEFVLADPSRFQLA